MLDNTESFIWINANHLHKSVLVKPQLDKFQKILSD